MKSEIEGRSTVFVFPLTHATLFQGTTKPLNIFEPRYIQMINDALDSETEVALAYSEPDPEAHLKRRGLDLAAPYFLLQRISPICGSGRVHLIERRADETMMILIEAKRKVRLIELEVGVRPYLRAQVETLFEDRTLSVDALTILNRLNHQFEVWLRRSVPDSAARNLFLEKTKETHDRVSAIASLMLENPIDAQEILEMNSLSERILTLGLSILEREQH